MMFPRAGQNVMRVMTFLIRLLPVGFLYSSNSPSTQTPSPEKPSTASSTSAQEYFSSASSAGLSSFVSSRKRSKVRRLFRSRP